MKCIPALTMDSDAPFWITREIFEREFDEADYHSRNEWLVESNYSKDWFYVDEDGNNRFRLPTVQIVSGATQFINGRHRTAVLFDKIDRLPIAFTAGNAVELARKLGLVAISENEEIELPDLPIIDRPEP